MRVQAQALELPVNLVTQQPSNVPCTSSTCDTSPYLPRASGGRRGSPAAPATGGHRVSMSRLPHSSQTAAEGHTQRGATRGQGAGAPAPGAGQQQRLRSPEPPSGRPAHMIGAVGHRQQALQHCSKEGWGFLPRRGLPWRGRGLRRPATLAQLHVDARAGGEVEPRRCVAAPTAGREQNASLVARAW